MKIGPKYKIARRLGASVFEKTQTAKYALSLQKRTKQFRGSRSNYAQQLLEKQRVRYTYLISEKQFAKYVKQVIEKKTENPANMLYGLLEKRLDNVVARAGFAPTRLSARQMVSHGHIMLNGKRMTIPSVEVREGDRVSIREGSKDKGLFADLDERLKETKAPEWLKVNAKKEIEVVGTPSYSVQDEAFNLPLVIQFYKR